MVLSKIRERTFYKKLLLLALGPSRRVMRFIFGRRHCGLVRFFVCGIILKKKKPVWLGLHSWFIRTIETKEIHKYNMNLDLFFISVANDIIPVFFSILHKMMTLQLPSVRCCCCCHHFYLLYLLSFQLTNMIRSE